MKIQSISQCDLINLYFSALSCSMGFDRNKLAMIQNDIKYDPGLNMCNIIIAKEKDEIASHASAFIRKLYTEKEVVKIGCVARVGTVPKYKNKGLNKLVMQQLLKSLKSQNCAAAVLTTSIPEYFERLGFISVPWHRGIEIKVNKLINCNSSSASIRPSNYEMDFPLFMDVYEQNKSNRIYRFERKKEYWAHWYKMSHFPAQDSNSHIFKLMMCDHTVGYAFCEWRYDVYYIKELALTKSYEIMAPKYIEMIRCISNCEAMVINTSNEIYTFLEQPFSYAASNKNGESLMVFPFERQCNINLIQIKEWYGFE